MVMKNKKIIAYRLRKIVHYALIACILLIQILIAIFFYNEFTNKKQLSFIEKQLSEIHSLEDLTDRSRKELVNAQDNFQKYIASEDDQYLQNYFHSVNQLAKNLDSINRYTKNPHLKKNIIQLQKKKSLGIENLKFLVDSTSQFSSKSDFKKRDDLPKLKKYNFDYNFDEYEIQTKTYSDTLIKKGIFGRLKDAFTGKVDVKKDSTVVTLKQGKAPDFSKLKGELDEIVDGVNNHYFGEVKKIQINTVRKQQSNTKYYKIFNNLLIYSNNLMTIYEDAVKDSRADLEKEYIVQNSASNQYRNKLVLGLMILMFIVSILIMYFTRIAFVYERKLNAANKQISENVNFKNRILGMLSHELRSPLKIIGIFIKRINKKTTDETVKEYLKSISFTNDTLLMQANQILEYTKNQQVQNKLIPVVFNLKEEITSILNAIEPYIETRNNEFIIHENIDSTLMVYSDKTKINQIFMNILGNANKFTENGKITVSSFTESIDEKTISLNTTINDTGVGISESDLEKIFEPYYQGIISDEVENLGAGLGLNLCKEIIALYPGKISVSSELSKGTTVQFSVNLAINESTTT